MPVVKLAPALDPKLVEQLKAEHGDTLKLLKAAGETVVVRPPRKVEYERFRDASFDEKKRARALEQLVREAVVHPSRDEFDALLQRKPALSEVFGARVIELAGAAVEAEVEDL
ncbi:MAG TPA: hypothetical protein VHN99_03775 [Deinococcales bacterium]|nr:hypothetical protein [Deinococcales bacterium]